MDNLFKRNYKANVNRGKITPLTKGTDFLKKCHEEQLEVLEEYYTNGETKHLAEEITDEIMVRVSWLMHMGFNPIEEIEKVTIKNETRHD